MSRKGPLGVGLLCMLALSTQTAAEPPSREEARVVLEIEGWWGAPRNLSLDYAFIASSGGLSGGGEVQTLEPGRRTEPRLRAAWQPGFEGAPRIGAAFWSTRLEERDGTGRRPGGVGALLASPDFAIGRSLVDEASASARVTATLVDAGLWWEIDGSGKGRLTLSAGVRLFRFDEEADVVYTVGSGGGALTEVIVASSRARGVGPWAAAGFDYLLGRRLRFGAELGVAFPQGDLRSTVSDTPLSGGVPGPSSLSIRPGDRRSFSQVEGSVRVQVALTERLALAAAFRAMSWPGVAASDRFLDDVSQNSALTTQTDASFEGLTLGVTYEF